MQIRRILSSFAFALAIALGLSLNAPVTMAQTENNQTTNHTSVKVGDTFTVTTVIHQPNGPDKRTEDETYMLIASGQSGTTRIVPNIHGTLLGASEPFPEFNQVPAVFSKDSFVTAGAWSCWWDAVRSRILTGNAATGIDPSHVGEIHMLVYRQKAGPAYVMHINEIKNLGGRITIEETYRMRLTNGQLLEAGHPHLGEITPYFRGQNIFKTNPFWFRLPMGTDPIFKAEGRFEDYVLKPNNVVETGLAYGYDVTMMCPLSPPQPPSETDSKFFTPYKFLCVWDCLSLQGCHGSKPIFIYFPNEDRLTNALDRPWLIRRYLQGELGELWANYVAVQIQAERIATPYIFYNATLQSLTGKHFSEPKQLSGGSWVLPTNTLRELLWFIRLTRNVMTEADKHLFVEVLSYMNWDASGLGSGSSRETYPETRSEPVDRDDTTRSITEGENAPVAFSSKQQSIKNNPEAIASGTTQKVNSETLSVYYVANISPTEITSFGTIIPEQYQASAVYIASGVWDGRIGLFSLSSIGQEEFGLSDAQIISPPPQIDAKKVRWCKKHQRYEKRKRQLQRRQ